MLPIDEPTARERREQYDERGTGTTAARPHTWTSVEQGKPIPAAWGTVRLPALLLLRGGPVEGQVGGRMTDITYGGPYHDGYVAPAVLGFCLTPAAEIVSIFRGSDRAAASLHSGGLSGVGATWSWYLTGAPGVVRYVTNRLALDDQGGTPEISIEARGRRVIVGGDPDALPHEVATDLVTLPKEEGGLGLAASRVQVSTGLDNTAASSYERWCDQAGFRVSGAAGPETKRETIEALATSTFSMVVYGRDKVKFVPLAGGALGTYVPPTPIAISSHDLRNITVERVPDEDVVNRVWVRFTDRSALYEERLVEYKDEAHASQYGDRDGDELSAPWITTAERAYLLAQLIVRRSIYERGLVRFDLDPRYGARLEVGDILSVQDGIALPSPMVVRIEALDIRADGWVEVETREVIADACQPVALIPEAAVPAAGPVWSLAGDAAVTADQALEEAQTRNRTYSQPGAPNSGPFTIGDLWYDSDGDNEPHRWDGNAWVSVRDGGIAIPQSGNVTYVSDSAPSGGLNTGDLWFESDNGNKLWRWNGTQWLSVQDSGAAAATTAAHTYFGPSSPTPPAGGFTVGDLWFDLDDGNKPYRWDGDSWEPVQDTSGPAGLVLAGSKTAVFYTAGRPDAASPGAVSGYTLRSGDLWFSTDSSTACHLGASCPGTIGDDGSQRSPASHRGIYWIHRWDGAAWTSSATGAKTITAQLADNAVQLAKIADGAVGLGKFASGLRPLQIVANLPSLPSATYPHGALVVLTTDNKVYRSTGSAWTAEVPASDIAGQITSTQITDDAITTPKLAANAVTAAELAADAVVAGKIAAGAVQAGDIAAGAVSATEIAAHTITANQIAAGTITATEIAAGTITALHLAADSVASSQIQAGAVTASELAAGAVVADKIAATAITSEKIAVAAITAQHLRLAPKSLNPDPTFAGEAAVWSGFVRRLHKSNTSVPTGCPRDYASEFANRDNWASNFVIPVVPGETFRASCYVNRGSGGGGLGLGIFGAGVDVNGELAGFAWPGSFESGAGWRFVSGTYTVPATSWISGLPIVGLVFGPWADRSTYTGEAWYADLHVEKQNDSSLIVDGAITADKIAAHALEVAYDGPEGAVNTAGSRVVSGAKMDSSYGLRARDVWVADRAIIMWPLAKAVVGNTGGTPTLNISSGFSGVSVPNSTTVRLTFSAALTTWASTSATVSGLSIAGDPSLHVYAVTSTYVDLRFWRQGYGYHPSGNPDVPLEWQPGAWVDVSSLNGYVFHVVVHAALA